jgi:phospholipase/lecithinase/hemolysin
MTRTRAIRLASLLIALLTPLAAARAEWRGGIGVLGDSYSDEYQFYPPHRSTARNWVEILATTRGLNFGRLSTQSRGEPRNQGFESNWARSDATTEDLIASGQHLGLAAQVTRGEVSLVVAFVGGNDFINAMKTPDPVAAFQQVGPRAAANLERAVATILQAHPDVKVVIVTVPDIRELPEFRIPLSTGRLPRASADAATAAIQRYNASIWALAAHQPRVAVLDFALFTRGSELIGPEAVLVAGHPIVRCSPGDAPDHLFLGDVRHLGTVGQGLLAELVVATINARFDAGVPPLSEHEILQFAARLAPGSPRKPDSRQRPSESASSPTAGAGVFPEGASSGVQVSEQAQRDPSDNGRHQDIGPMTLRAFLTETLRSRTASPAATPIAPARENPP